MTNENDKPDYFQHRWGVKEWDVGATTIPNPVLVHYSKVPWIDKDGKRGRGISNQEMLCIVHLASFHYESEQGESRPAIGTVARRMGYKKDDSVRGLIKSLEHKNLLMVERRPGKCSIYDFSNFSKAILKMDEGQPPHSNGGLSDGGHSNGPHSQGDKEEKIIKEEKQKEEKKEKEELPDFPKKSQEADDDIQIQGDTGNQILETGSPAAASHTNPIREVLRGEVSGQVVLSSPDSRRDHGPAREGLDYIQHLVQYADKEPNIAVPPSAGGADAVAGAALVALHQAKGGSAPRAGTGTYIKETEAISQALRDRDIKDLDVAVLAVQMFVKDKPKLACPHYKSFVGDLGEYLGKAQARVQRRAPPPPDDDYEPEYFSDPEPLAEPVGGDCPVGKQVKSELALQMTRGTFDKWVQPAQFTQDDGVLYVAAPDEFSRDWLKNRLARIIERTVVGVLDREVKVEFEVTP